MDMNKKISNVCIILVMSFSINTFSQTNTNTLEDMCLGTLAIAPDLPISAFQKYTIPVTSTNSGKTNYKSVKISFNNNDTACGLYKILSACKCLFNEKCLAYLGQYGRHV